RFGGTASASGAICAIRKVNCAFSYRDLTAAFRAISCSRAIRGVVFFPGEQIVKIRLVAFSTVLFLGNIEFAMVNIADPRISRVHACYLGSIKTPPLLVA